MRIDKRAGDELRPTTIKTNVMEFSLGSVLIEVGKTKVLCTAMVDDKLPAFLRDTGQGWVSAEYAMLPGATPNRKARDSKRGRMDGRSQEIQRLIGRSLRSIVDLKLLGERMIWVDCDVIQADVGTRTAAITGGWVALALACKKLVASGVITKNPLIGQVAAVSAGIYQEEVLLDLCYVEDSGASVDFNMVMDDQGNMVEIQGTAEGKSFTEQELMTILTYGKKGVGELLALQLEALNET